MINFAQRLNRIERENRMHRLLWGLLLLLATGALFLGGEPHEKVISVNIVYAHAVNGKIISVGNGEQMTGEILGGGDGAMLRFWNPIPGSNDFFHPVLLNSRQGRGELTLCDLKSCTTLQAGKLPWVHPRGKP